MNVSLLISLILAVLAFWYCPVPWSAGFFLTAVLFANVVRSTMRTGLSVLMVNIAAVLLALAIFEGYIGIVQIRGDGTRVAGTITDGFTHADDVLGYAPDRDARVTARKYYGETLLYDVVYTIDGQGLRIAPPVDKTAPKSGCLVFFGDSNTFGEGVHDAQTFPYRVGVKTNGRYLVRNFAFSGYGPHQMLAELQSGLFDQRTNCKPTQFFYLAIPEHVARVAGLTSWDRHGPRFILTASGDVVRVGNFDDPARIFGQATPRWVDQTLDKFFAWQRLFGRARDPNQGDLRLFIGVVHASARLAKQRYPHSYFHVLLWDGDADERLAIIEQQFKSAGILTHRISEGIPDFGAKKRRYALSIHDPHPNPLQHERIANYLVREVLGEVLTY